MPPGGGPGMGMPPGGGPGMGTPPGGMPGAGGGAYGGGAPPTAGQGYPQPDTQRTGRRTEESVLVVTMSCESTVIASGLQYIEEKVIAKLKDLPSTKDGRPVFSHVQLVGRQQDVYRDARTGKLIGATAAEGDRKHFVAFNMIAQVNIGRADADAEEED